jgi:ubiquinone/menaquinone biosynthesis C-methylase UbiE
MDAEDGKKPTLLEKQVETNHYEFVKYVDKNRWYSFYHQIFEILSLKPDSVLEIGIGSGILGVILKHIKFPYESMDIDKELRPDHVGSVLQMPFPDKTYDVIVCFQVLEHLPYKNFIKALNELFRVARKYVVLSLPDAGSVISIHIPKICRKALLPRPFVKKRKHIFDGEHYWEINKKGYEINGIKADIKTLAKENNFLLERSYRIWENPYHHFFILRNIRGK